MDRRTFLTRFSAVAAAGFLLPRSAAELGPRGAHAGGEPVRDLPEIRGASGVLDHRIDLAATQVRLRDRVLTLDAYNGQVPGQVLRIRPGDTLRILLRNLMRPMGIPLNRLPPLCASHPGGTPDTTGPPDSALGCVPHALGELYHGDTLVQTMLATNLHTHGLQVSPSGDSDNVFVRIDPLGSHQYSYDIPADHPAGLHWYHPHFHGSTSHQGWAGLSGPIVVEGDIDAVPEIADMRERILVCNELWVGDDTGEVPTTLVIPTGGPVPFNGFPAIPSSMYFTVNGQLLPEIHLRPGETQRWRVLNAAPHRALWLHVEGHTLHQIGQDGIPFDRPRPRSDIMLTAANRAEFVIQGGAPGRYRVHAPAYDQGHPGGARPSVQLATLVVAGPPATGRVPTRLVDPPRMPDLPVAHHRVLRFSGDISGRHGIGVRFFIDGKEYHHDRIDQQVEAGTVEEWTMVNEDVFQHPIHIHVNPFQVTDVRGIPPGDTSWAPPDPTVWWDTFRLPPRGRFTLRTHFRPDLTGKTVFHCHILPHEDNGMMGNLLITPPEKGS
ncbi:Multicopper oxidase with three cupredoxin domains (includes cell division protein FtsP and spore coat protein CotA) [Amycolatopsis arida]|uniref:Multicopper oxidase with three cupredoxin domains (Includes cell division protein FtsP and spore coat protein CotA) n=1 Tax=Amycolatopsis arida TaxID=587909 RepID=A0A1I6ARX5_9PSEU|nr:multicopper oxidase domain-containing protein [Amycolatopsis arida]TDX97569.1 FtsP/CotA-like multicopper oxidase with cupredoxin domain [Amycolatopsis arida]SFQ71468.1 Multicopper oxidase with three cupredoxin domains (includes cell division protein FtsP and spore coat protein CotA) [Amycolatopsis arida]